MGIPSAVANLVSNPDRITATLQGVQTLVAGGVILVQEISATVKAIWSIAAPGLSDEDLNVIADHIAQAAADLSAAAHRDSA